MSMKFLCRKSSNAAVVLSNGGCQRGHTVNSDIYGRHVFHHFGSGAFQQAPTYFAHEFLLNPMHWNKERLDLALILGKDPVCYRNSKCRFQMPIDIYLNRLIENTRGKCRHGSVGSGIYETILRYQCQKSSAHTFSKFLKYSFKDKVEYIKDISRWYAELRIQDFYQVEHLVTPEETKAFVKKQLDSDDYKMFISDGMVEHYCADCEEMGSLCQEKPLSDAVQDCNTVVFEQGQGLMLDPAIRSKSEVDDTTPSHPGTSKLALDILELSHAEKIDVISVNYVSRTYLTKHGAGKFVEDPTISFEDKTNIPNEFQGTLRFGQLDYRQLFERINRDFGKFITHVGISGYPIIRNLAFTHVNEIDIPEKYKSSAKYCFSTDVSERL